MSVNALVTTEIARYRGDSCRISLPLTDPDASNAAFNPAGNRLLFTLKSRDTDPDSAALVQKFSDVGGITLVNPSIVTLVSADWDAITFGLTYEIDIQAENLSTGEIKTVSRGTIFFPNDVTKNATPSVAIYTTQPAALIAVQNRAVVTGLASLVADETKLAGIATLNAVPVGSTVCLNLAVTVDDGAGGTYAAIATVLFQLLSSTHATAVPLWLRPFDYDASANPCAWRLLGVFIDTVPAAWNGTTSKFHYMTTVGAAGAVSIAPDQVGVSLPA